MPVRIVSIKRPRASFGRFGLSSRSGPDSPVGVRGGFDHGLVSSCVRL